MDGKAQMVGLIDIKLSKLDMSFFLLKQHLQFELFFFLNFINKMSFLSPEFNGYPAVFVSLKGQAYRVLNCHLK